MQVGFYFDQTRCTGCCACSIACKDWHDTPAGPVNWMRISNREEGQFPNLLVSYCVMPCYHCANPVCSFVCPNEAITKDDDSGVVIVDSSKCREEHPCGIISSVATDPEYLYGDLEAPCQLACPAHLHIPGYVALIAKGKFSEALELIRQRMPLPSICGRVCLNPCETECRRQEVDKPIAIEALKRFVSDYVSPELPQPIPPKYNQKVAIIGSGPAGLAAAYDLVRMGYGVTIYEALPVAGGMLAAGIPEYRLPREVLQRDIDYIKALGVEIITGTAISSTQGLKDLFVQGYGALLLALGAQTGRVLKIPGADMEGVLVGTDFMRDVNFHKTVKVGKRVLVIGGGNVALDCARSARRLGAAEVHVACLESRESMTAEATEIEQAEEEGIQIHPSYTPKQITGDEGSVNKVECLKITDLLIGQDGEAQFSIIEESVLSIPADTVIFAIGQAPDLAGMNDDNQIEMNKSGTIAADPETLMTGHCGIFCAGDVLHGTTSVIEAIGEGQRAAFFINRYLQGDVLRVREKPTIKASEIKVTIPDAMERMEPHKVSLLPVEERMSNFNEVSLGFNVDDAMKEAARCLNCAGHLCKDVCPYGAPQFGDEEKAKMQKCDYCLERFAGSRKPVCVEACPVRALDSGDIEELRVKYGNVSDARGLAYSPVVQPAFVAKSKQAQS